ncbi:MAG: DUF1080 domain-containing protein [Ginsengibacter sp.]
MKKLSTCHIKIKLYFLVIPFLFLMISTIKVMANKSNPAESDSLAIQGRWDITIDMDGATAPSWLEIYKSGARMLVGRFVGTGGSSRPISRIILVDGKMSFSIPPQWDNEPNDLMVEGTLQNDMLKGAMTFPNGKTYQWTGKRAPLLHRDKKPVWGKPIHLFDGTNLNQWHATGKNQWKAESGLLRSPHSGSNLVTNQTFKDFKLHIEFRFPAESNSGVYLRGRYEVQIEDGDEPEPDDNQMGAIYGFIAPSEPLPRIPGKWQSYDITITGRMLTIVANGKTIICNREIPGITGGAINSDEGDPGPILLQGDHGPIDYRNIIITPAE